MAETHTDRDNRRYPRHEVVFPIQIELASGANDSEVTRGVTINLARGGVLASLSGEVHMGARCVVHFPEGRFTPDTVEGTVRRVQGEGQSFVVAIGFDSPLEQIPI